MVVRVTDSLGSVADASFPKDVVDVGLDGGLADDEGGSDLGVGHTARDELEHLDLAPGQVIGR